MTKHSPANHSNESDQEPAVVDQNDRLAQSDYRPIDPHVYKPHIGLIGCGGITKHHLMAYCSAGYQITALCDLDLEKARQRQAEFYPDAVIYSDYMDLLRQDDIEVVDIATHPAVRTGMIESALQMKKHVLSQKPFVLDLDTGQYLVDLAERCGVKLAVNQNARWAPHFSYMRQAIAANRLGPLFAAHFSVHWNHGWVAGTEFEKIKHLILYDFAIHWFDLINCFMTPRPALRVYASTANTTDQAIRPALLGQALIEYEDAQASLAFDGDTRFGNQDRSYLAGGRGSISSVGPGNQQQQLAISTAEGTFFPDLTGKWFPDGFHGTMGELLVSIEENRETSISAANNLHSLALCFAAVASAERHEPVIPGSVRKLSGDG